MSPEIETYSQYIRDKIAEIHAALGGRTEEDLNRAPDLPEANSPFVIATHTFGNIRAWVLGIVCGQDLSRDRPAEFASLGSYEELGVASCKLSGEVEAALQGLDPQTLDDRFVPSRKLWGEGEPREITK
ncbi:MAG: hypothetical protein ABIP58_00795 [Dehalococcoidia bacterium]